MKLTPRQRDIAELVAKGLPSSAIATELGLSERTVDVHIQNAAARLGGSGRPRHRLTIWFFGVVEKEHSKPM